MDKKNLARIGASMKDISDELIQQLDAEAERADYLLGLLASIRELVGQIAMGVYQSNNKDVAATSPQDAIKAIDQLMPYLTAKQQRAVKSAIKFHDAAINVNKMHPNLKPAWRDDHPLHAIEKLNFVHVVNSYY